MLSRAFLVLWLAMFTAIAGIAMVSPLLPVYVREQLDGPEVAVALSFSALALSQLVTSPFIGRLGDRFGYKPFIVAGFAIYGLGALGYLVASNWQLVVFFRAFSGLGAAGIFPMAMAYVGRLSPPGHEGRYMGVFSIAMTAGYGFGPLLGGAIRDLVNADAAFATMAGLLFAVGVITVLLLPGRPARSDGRTEADEPVALPWTRLMRRPMVQATVVGQTLISIGWGAGFSFIAVYVVSADGLNTGSATFVGILIAVRSTIGSSFQSITGQFADRYDRAMLAVVGLAVAAVAQFLVPDVPATTLTPSVFGFETTVLPWLLVLFLVVGLGEAVAMPAIQAVLVDTGRSVGMGSIMGLGQMGQSLGFLGGSLMGALVVELFGLGAVFRYAGIVIMVGALVFLALMLRAPPTARRPWLALVDRQVTAPGGR